MPAASLNLSLHLSLPQIHQKKITALTTALPQKLPISLIHPYPFPQSFPIPIANNPEIITTTNIKLPTSTDLINEENKKISKVDKYK